MKTRRTEVTIETDEIWIVRRQVSGFVAWCPRCGEQTTMITPDEAAILLGLTVRDIYRQVETGLIHYVNMPGGIGLVCSTSIMNLTPDAT